jgi:uridine monophosphate synthetase
METFFSLLDRHVQVCNSLLCVGLDPHPGDLPAPTAEAALEFCLRLVKATARYAAAYKPNAAFFEMYGPEGWAALKQVIEAVRAESQRTGSVIPVILDAKRGDIASTAGAYAQSTFHALGAHAVTLSPYLGQDSLLPFTADREKGVFLLCKTSNPRAGDLQDLPVMTDASVVGRPSPVVRLYEQVALLAQAWNSNGNIGLVVGATQLEALRRVRALAPELWFLAPGVGAQGGDLEAALEAGLRADGWGMLIPVSRGISRADNWAEAARELRDSIEHVRYALSRRRAAPRAQPAGEDARLGSLADGLLKAGCIKFGDFTLKSGQRSPIYLDLRQLVSHPSILKEAARAYAEVMRALTFDRLAGLPYAALPIGTAVSLEMDRPLIYPRREVKDYGTKAAVEGDFHAGETVCVLDDLATTGGTKIEAIQKLEAAGLKVRDIVVLIDREQGAGAMLAEAGYTLHAVVTLRQLLTLWRESNAITEGQYQATMEFLAGEAKP